MLVFLTTRSYPFFQLDPVTKKLKPIELVANGVSEQLFNPIAGIHKEDT
jgi:hypothetical protein